MSIATRSTINQIIECDNGNMRIRIVAIEGAVQTIDIGMIEERHSIVIPHNNTLQGLEDLHTLIGAAMTEAKIRGVKRM